MKKTMKKMLGRIAILAVMLLLVASTFAGCATKATKTLTVGSIATGTENALGADQLKQIADMLALVYSADFDTQEMLVAASRGYNMTIENFDDSQVDPNVVKPADLEAAKRVITLANEKASSKITVDYSALNEADLNTLISAFSVTVDLTNSSSGMFDPILGLIGKILGWLTNTLCFGNYLVGICLFAVIIEILMLPFAIKQQKNSIRQASLRPKEMAIRNKYKGRTDQVTMQKMQQEIQEFYQRENFSPYSGCLPLLIQLPIIMALYSIVIDPLHYVLGQGAGISDAITTFYTAARAAGGLGGALPSGNGTIAILSELKAVDLSALANFRYFTNGSEVLNSFNGLVGNIPNFNIGPFNFGLVPSFANFNILLLVPVLTFGTYFLTSKLNRKFIYQAPQAEGVDPRQTACSNTMMDVTMPLMSAAFTFMVPALVGIYWIFRSLVGLAKQFIISRAMPLPTFTEEDYKAAAKEMAGKRVVQKSSNVGKVRSLHRIDDEDFEDTRERALARKAAIEERERQEQEEKAKKTPFGAPSMKEDNKKGKKDKAEMSDESDLSADEASEKNDTESDN